MRGAEPRDLLRRTRNDESGVYSTTSSSPTPGYDESGVKAPSKVVLRRMLVTMWFDNSFELTAHFETRRRERGSIADAAPTSLVRGADCCNPVDLCYVVVAHPAVGSTFALH